MGNLIGTGPNKLLDSSKYFIIAVDAIGNGISTSPSNSVTQNGKDFPQFTMRDMVNSQYELVTKVLGLDHLYAAIGGSMGSMQVLQWAVSYPDFVDKIVAYVPTPWSNSYDMLVWSTRLQIIESAQRVNMPEKDIMKSLSMLIQSIAQTPNYFVKNIPREKFDEYLKSFDREPSKTFTSYDYASQLRAMINLDISKNLESKEKLKDVIKAKVFMIISLQDHIVHPQPALDFAELIGAEKLVFDSECGHLVVNCEMEKCSKAIAEFLKELKRR
ncbi:MAG: alpha/beta fold hydrolase [Bacteroidetes bacterium]|nr:alpha/beta fold hydrolase [Bacteroidota bacterium]